MYKLIFLDMDGTLLNDNKTISKENKKAIKAAREKGVKVILCTGRPLEGIRNYLNELDLISSNNYCVTCSGAMVMSNTGENIISKRCFSTEELGYLCCMAQFLDIDFTCYSNERFSTYRHSLHALLDSKVNCTNYEVLQFEDIIKDKTITKVNLINEHIGALEDYPKIFGIDTYPYRDFIFRENADSKLFADRSGLPFYLFENFSVLKLCDYSYEILTKNTHKGAGVETLSSYLNIPLSDIICIGDSGNDEHMIKCAGLGVAMGNATDDIKASAKYVTLSNEENGVAHVIEKFILQS